VKIGVIAGSTYPSSPNNYGSEVMAAVLADELGRKHDVMLIAASGSIKGRYKLKLLPNLKGNLSYQIESLVMNYFDELKECDYVIDMSPLCMYCEELYFWHREMLDKQVVVYSRNGTNAFNPRVPVNMNLHGVCLSYAARNEITKNFNIPSNLLHVIPYGIRLDWYRFKRKKKDYLLYLGAPRKEKGIFKILEIAKRLPNEHFIFAWRAINDEHKRTQEEFLKKAKKLSNVEFIELPEGEEHFRAKVRLYQNAKALIKADLKSYIEALGLVSIEAMSCGTPVITASHGANPEVVANGKTGFLCKSIKEYVNAIKNVHVIEPKACRRHVEINFSSRRFAESYLKLYEEIKNENVLNNS